MRNNRDRLQRNAAPDDAPVEAVTKSGNIFDFVTPTEIVDLPSKGKFYPEDHPLHGVDQIEIRFMTAKDEDILSSPALLKRGVAIDRFLQNIIIDKTIDVRSLLIGDKNALIIASRITGFGHEYPVGMTCSTCGYQHDYIFDLTEITAKDPVDLEDLNSILCEDGTIQTTLPYTKIDTKIKPLLVEDEYKISDALKKQESRGQDPSPYTTQLKTMIVGLNDVTNRAQIHQFVDMMPTRDSKHINSVYAKAFPNIDMKQNVSCPQCAAEEEVNVPITVNFFWSRE